MTNIFGSSHPILRFLNGLAKHTPWLHGVATAYAVWAGLVILALLVVAGWLRARMQSVRSVAIAVWTPIGCVIALGFNQLIGHAVAEPRPYEELRNVDRLVPVTHDYSFPSDHAVAAGGVIVGLWLIERRLGILGAIFGLLLAADRVYVGAHYGHDVIAGLLLGGLVVLLGRWLVVPILERIGAIIAATRWRPLVVNARVPIPAHRGSVVGSGSSRAAHG